MPLIVASGPQHRGSANTAWRWAAGTLFGMALILVPLLSFSKTDRAWDSKLAHPCPATAVFTTLSPSLFPGIKTLYSSH